MSHAPPLHVRGSADTAGPRLTVGEAPRELRMMLCGVRGVGDAPRRGGCQPAADSQWPARPPAWSCLYDAAPAPARGGWPGPPPGPLRIGPSKPMRRRRSARRTLQAAIWHRPSAMYRSVDRLPRSGPDGLQHKGPRCHAASQPAAIRPSASTTTNRMERYARRPPGRPVMPLATASRSKGRYFTRRRALVNPPGAPGFVGIAICPGYFASYWHAGATDLGPAQEGPSCTNSGP